MKCTYSNTLCHVDLEYIWLWGSISKTLVVVALFMHLQERDALRKCPLEMKHTYPNTLSHVVSENIYGYGIYLQNPSNGCSFFMHLQERDALGKRPLEMKYTYPNTLSHVVSEYIWLWGSISKILGVVACFLSGLSWGAARVPAHLPARAGFFKVKNPGGFFEGFQ